MLYAVAWDVSVMINSASLLAVRAEPVAIKSCGSNALRFYQCGTPARWVP